MSSVREQILEAIKAAVTASGGPTGLTVQRFATYPADPSAQLPMVKFYWITDPADMLPPRGTGPLVKQAMQVQFECYATGLAADGTESDAAVDALLIWVEQRLYVDPKFGHLALYVLPIKADAVAVSEDRTYVRVDAVYEVHYTHRPGDLTTRA